MPNRSQGGHAGLSREAVLEAALVVADRDGLEGLTMRRVASELGVEAMSLYHHVRNKDDMLDGIVERLVALAADPADDATPWAQALIRYAFRLRDALLAHPGVAVLALTRPAATPESLALAEQAIGRLVRAGFTLGHALDALNALSTFVIGHTVSEIATSLVNEDAGPGSASAVSMIDPGRYPLLVRAAREEQGSDDSERLRFAVAAMLDGFARTVGAASQQTVPAVVPRPAP